MTAPVAAGTEIGRTCPYCRFALKDGVLVQRCHVCDAVHHDDCWRDGGGCAIFGCQGANAVTSTAPPPPPAAVYPPPPPPMPPPGGPAPDRSKVVLLAVIGVLVIAIAALGGYLATSRSGDAEPDAAARSGGSEQQASTPAPTAEATEEPTVEPTPDPAVRARRAARRIQAIVAFSLEGRTAVREGRFGDAVANRRTVLRRLRAIRGTTGELKSAKTTLEKAMDASLRSDIAYQEGRDASATDAEATRLKQEFAEKWAPVAAEHDLREYAPGDI